MAAAGHDVDAVKTVNVAVIALVPDTIVFGSEKQPFVNAGLLVTVHAIVPVYPFCGVIVTIEVIELPAGTAGLVADSVKVLFPGTVSESVPLEGMYVESPEYAAEIVCEPVVAEENVYVAAPFESICVGAAVPSTLIVNVPVGAAVTDADPDATVIVITSFAPAAGVVVAADSVVLEATLVTVTVSEPVDAAYVLSPEYVAAIVCAPAVAEEKT